MNPNPSHMQRAIELASNNVLSGAGGPFGAVVVFRDEIVAEGVNQVTATNDPTAHAEVVAIRAACASLGSFQLSDCDIYTSCEPCPMCLAALYWSRCRAIYFGNTAEDAAGIGFDDRFIYDEIKRPLVARKIPILPLLSEKAIISFQHWKAQTNKTEY